MATKWSDDEIIIAMEFYYACPERMHTDSHDKCKEIARMMGRPPGGLDGTIRNIKFTDTGRAGRSHASKGIIRLVSQYKNNQAALRTRAAAIRRTNGWPPLNCD